MTLNSYIYLLRTGVVLASVALFSTTTSAKPIPENMGYGLDKLVESKVMLQSAPRGKAAERTLYNGFATQDAANYDARSIKAEDGRYMVDITLNGKLSCEELKEALQSQFGSFEITSVDASYHKVGIIEGWVSVDEAAALAQAKGVRAVFLALKPQLHGVAKGTAGAGKGELPQAPPTTNLALLGTKFMQGVTQHRVDKINQFYNPSAPVNYDGSGITVGVLSDSFDTRGTNTATQPNATTNVNNFDLPGSPNNPINTTPIVVLQDFAGGTDEGRGMSEIVYKMAPKAKIGFATADTGEVGFGNNIRALSGRFPSVPNTRADFKADVICDDVAYGGEPVFADGGVIASGVDDVAAMGVSYFSSAANSYGVSVYNSDLRWIPNGTGVTAATNAALVGTNIDLTNVPTNLYQGGFHNFNPNGQDVACTWTVSNGGIATEMQWDDPYDSAPPVLNQPPIYSNSGTISGTTTSITFSDVPPLSAGTKYVINETATSGNFDGIVSILDANNNIIVDQDTGTDESVTFFPPASGQYKIAIRAFGTTTGSFNLTVNTASGQPLLTTDINMLAFRVADGVYVPASSLTSNNFANNRPVELGTATGVGGQLQFVIARSTVPTAPRSATRIRLGTDSNSNPNNAPAEYYDYNSAVTGGHDTAAGCNGMAAYDVFRPNIPQNFTSAGPALIYFDKNNNLVPNAPEVRLQPRLAAANNANTTWIGGDSANDVDTGNGQFGGTSAASPHGAAIAALVLQAHGGTGSVTPTQMTSILQRSTFMHDLDPYLAAGAARASNGGKVNIAIRSDNTATAARGRNDPNSFSISYVGPSSIKSFVFNPNGTAAQGGGVTSGQNGVDASNNYFSNVTPGLYFATAGTGSFAFTPGPSVGVAGTDASIVLTNPAPTPAPTPGANGTQGRTLTVNFANSTFAGGSIFRFTIGRGLERGPNVSAAGAALASYNSDLFGGGVLIPDDVVISDGMSFSGTLNDTSTFSGVIRNRIGSGYSNLDGFGFINAEKAVTTPIQ